MFFSRFAETVTMLVRARTLEQGMSRYLVDQILAAPNINVRPGAVVIDVMGEQKLECITVKDVETGATETLQANAMFIFVGAVPHSRVVTGLVECDSAGFILTGQDLIREGKHPKGWTLNRDPYYLETSVPGIFTVGDVRHGAVRRVASAVGEGAIAVGLVHQYLKTV
jgi:thioredoxin reductase (NADPH)